MYECVDVGPDSWPAGLDEIAVILCVRSDSVKLHRSLQFRSGCQELNSSFLPVYRWHVILI